MPQPVLTRQAIEIATIRIDGGTQVRVQGIDQDTVERYAELWQEHGDECPLAPVKLMRDREGELWLFDGYHTREAAVRANRKKLIADIYDGTLDEARWLACFVQSQRGLALTRQDLRHAMIQAIKINQQRATPLSQRALAKQLGVAVGTLQYQANKLAIAGELELPAEIQVQRGDTTYTLVRPVHTFEQLVELYRPLGVFARTGDRRHPFELERPGKSVFFRCLDDAFDRHVGLSRDLQPVAELDFTKRDDSPSVVPFNRDYGKEWANLASDRIRSDANPESELLICKPAIAPADVEPVAHPAGVIASAESCEHYTPEPIWRAALAAFGVTEFDLDPATYAESPIPCKQFFTKADDGLAQDWHAATLWSNFPYSDRDEDDKRQIVMQKWVRKLVEAYDAGTVKRAITLVKSDCRPEWFHELLDYATAFCFIKKAVKFIRPDGIETKGGSFFGSIVFYLGDEVDEFYRAFAPLGAICQSINPEMFGE